MDPINHKTICQQKLRQTALPTKPFLLTLDETLADIAMRHIITILLFSILTASSFGQVDSSLGQVDIRKNRVGFGTFHQDSTTIQGISVGFWADFKKK
jgi:hypothetical protein